MSTWCTHSGSDLLNGFKDISANSKSLMLEFLINVTNQKLLMEEMCTKFDAMCMPF